MAVAAKPTARDRRIQHHAEMAATAFAHHKIEQRLNQGMFRSWRCKRPDSWCYGFDVTTTPGSIFITGDIGTLVVERTEDMIVWCRGSINSIEYFAEKVSREIPTVEFDRDVACEFIKNEIEELRSRDPLTRTHKEADWEQLLNGLDECSESQFYVALGDSGLIDPCDCPSMRNYIPRFLWQREALKWFLANLGK